jgi:hypothetical protein
MPDLTREALRKLHDEYVEAVNMAVAEGRDDLVEELVAAYPDAALRLVADEDGTSAA